MAILIFFLVILMQIEGIPHEKKTSQSTEELWLDTMDLSGVMQEWGQAKANKSVEGKQITIAGKTYKRGIGTHAYSEFNIDLKTSALEFEAWVGVDSEIGKNPGSVVFQVYVDGKKSFDSGVMKVSTEAKHVQVELKGAKILRLVVTDADDGNSYDHADWAMAKLAITAGSKEKPAPYKGHIRPAVILTPKPPDVPRINGPRIFGCRPGSVFLYTIPATGKDPIKFSAEGLPSGLKLDKNSGQITGSVKEKGSYKVELSATNSLGKDTIAFEMVIGDKICLVPPMGWNSWNCWGTSVDDAKIRAAADAMFKSGLAKHGWSYINIDDAWEGKRDKNGVIIPNSKFPDMKALGDHIHSKGLKFGIYTSPGPKTCAGYEGSFGHEEQDAKTYASWGVDYVKHDWCSCQSKDLKEPYKIMRKALDKLDRDILYSLCQYGMGNVWEWGAEVGGNCWRTTGDIFDTWMSMSKIGFGQNGHEKYAGPGHWNDPDMLVVGMVGWGPKVRQTRLAADEQYTHVSLWSLLAAPLLIGCDLSQLDEFTLNLLTNDEVLAVNQDRLGKQGYRVKKEGDSEVWIKPLYDGTIAVGLFNLNLLENEVSVTWEDLKIKGLQQVRDLWRQKDLGEKKDGFTATIAPHGVVLVRIGTPKDE